jgi:ribosomal protein L11 methylase PrmA
MTSIVWTQFLGAPWVPTSMRMVRTMLELAEVKPGDRVYDLGCGDGRMIITAARRYGACAIGIEVDPLRYLWCRMLVTLLGLRDQVSIIYGDFFSQDLREADVVTCFLMQETNDRLEGKLQQELKPGAWVVSNQFSFSGLRLVQMEGEARLYRIVPKDKEETLKSK